MMSSKEKKYLRLIALIVVLTLFNVLFTFLGNVPEIVFRFNIGIVLILGLLWLVCLKIVRMKTEEIIAVIFLVTLTTVAVNIVESVLRPSDMGVKALEQNSSARKVGNFSITLLQEWQGEGKSDILIGITDEMMRQTLPDSIFLNAVNAFLVETEDKTILFDTGFGWNLFNNLKACGKSTDSIDIIFLTHMHGDHIGGLLSDGQISFTNAMLYIPQPEFDFLMDENSMLSLSENDRNNFADAHKVIEVYREKIRLFVPGGIDDKKELLPGIRSIAAYGHSPGHTGYLLESDGSKLFIWGDLTHAIAVQMPFPEVAITYDVYPEQAIESRLKLFSWLADQKIPVAGMHIQSTGMGIVEKNPLTHTYSFLYD